MSKLQSLSSKAGLLNSYESSNKHTWCSGCGNFGIINALKRALTLEDIQPEQTMLCYDVGCNGNESDKIQANTIHGLHGRVLPLAAGIALANPKLTVVAQAGDGATFSEGINHLIHAVRNNYNLTFICHNNSNYGLTIGQASSTTRQGYPMNASPDGVPVAPLNTMDMVLALNPSFVARSFSGDVSHMAEMIRQGLNHKGFSYIEVLQACPTFNKATPQEWYWDKIQYVEDLPRDIWEARKLVSDMDNELNLGVIYKNLERRPLIENIESRNGIDTSPAEEVHSYDISPLLQAFK